MFLNHVLRDMQVYRFLKWADARHVVFCRRKHAYRKMDGEAWAQERTLLRAALLANVHWIESCCVRWGIVDVKA